MDKRDRNYSLYVQEGIAAVLFNNGFSDPVPITSTANGYRVIELPFTIEFDVLRKFMGSASTAKIRVYNLNEKTRDLIFQPPFNYGISKQVLLRAGYGDNLPTIFNGFISEAFSVREGVNFITEIESLDGGYAFATSDTSLPIPSGTNLKSVLENMIASLPGVKPGVVGDGYSQVLRRGNSYSGSTTDLLKELSGGGFFIDNGKAYCLNDNECLRGDVQVINSDSGLLGTPKFSGQQNVVFDMIFEPRLLIGQKLTLESSTAKRFNGPYKVVGLHHRGLISDSVCGSAITTVELLNTENALREVV